MRARIAKLAGQAVEVVGHLALWVAAGAFVGCLILAMFVGLATVLERCP